MSWRFWQLYVPDAISAPTLYIGVGLGLILAGLLILSWLSLVNLLEGRRRR